MIVVIYGPFFRGEEHKSTPGNFIVQTLSFCFQAHKEHQFVLLNAGKTAEGFSGSAVYYNIKPEPANSIAKKIWWSITLPNALKKLKADIFVSMADRCSLQTSIPQSLVIYDTRQVKQRSLTKARRIIVLSKSIKQTLLANHDLKDDKVFVVQPFPDPEFKPVTEDKETEIKRSFSDGKEFFLYYHSTVNNESVIEMLKAFSVFKKRQESSMKLLIIGKTNGQSEKSLSNYKYRHDVSWIEDRIKTVITEITAAAYAVIIPFNTDSDPFIALNAMGAGIPVITTKDTDVIEIAGDSILFADSASSKSISEKMMQIYIDENLRSALIEKAKLAAQNFTFQRSAEQMWQAFMKAMN